MVAFTLQLLGSPWACAVPHTRTAATAPPTLRDDLTHPTAPATPDRPNFILILADDQGFGDLGVYGATDFGTPHIDGLAAQGLVFTDFYAQPACGPARTALLTGSYPNRVAEINNEKRFFPYVHPREILLPSVLQRAGYETAWIGKLDITDRVRGYREELSPIHRGFDHWFGPVGANDNGYVPLLHRNDQVLELRADLDDLTERYTQEALAFIDHAQDKPFFLYIAHTMPHVALDAGDAWDGATGRVYGDVVQEIDASVGRIRARLEALGLDRRTVLFYTSDNGPWSNHARPEYAEDIAQHAGSSGPLRGAKNTTWEGGVRVPAIAWGPGRIPPGRRTSELATLMDLLPTCIAMAGATLPSDRVLDGRDLTPLLTDLPGARSPHDAFYYYTETHLDAVRSGRWKLVFERPARMDAPYLLNHGKAYVGEVHEPVEELALFDLVDDIGETTNVAAQHPEEVARLQLLAEHARHELGHTDRIGSGVRFFDPGPRWPHRQAWFTRP